MLRFLNLVLAICFLAAFGLAQAQEKSPEPPKPEPPREDIYVAGGDVKPPKVIHYVEPEFSPASQEAYVEGVVRIAAVVNLDGIPSDLHVTKGLSDGEDKLALDALKQWRFKPGTKKDQPVRVRINVEINFHLL